VPTYDFVCSNTKCNHRQTRIFAILEYDAMTLKDKPCENPDKRRKACDGTYESTFDNGAPDFTLSGPGWTPKFHHGANQG